MKAHREHCQRLETTLQNLEEQANNLPQIPPDMISTIHELKKDVLFTFHFPSQNSEYDLSCDCDDVDNDIKSNIRYAVSNKMSIVTIFGHKHFEQKFHQ